MMRVTEVGGALLFSPEDAFHFNEPSLCLCVHAHLTYYYSVESVIRVLTALELAGVGSHSSASTFAVYAKSA